MVQSALSRHPTSHSLSHQAPVVRAHEVIELVGAATVPLDGAPLSREALFAISPVRVSTRRTSDEVNEKRTVNGNE